MRKATLPADNAYLFNTQSVLALARAEAGDVEGGEVLAQSAYDQLLAKLGANHQLTQIAKERLVQIDALKAPAANP